MRTSGGAAVVMLRKGAWVLSLFVLLLTGCLGLYTGITEFNQVSTPLQRSVNIGVLPYGVLGLVTAYGVLRKRQWSVWSAVAWTIAITYVPPAAIIGYGDEDASWASAAIAGFASLLLGLAVIWTAKTMTRRDRTADASM